MREMSFLAACSNDGIPKFIATWHCRIQRLKKSIAEDQGDEFYLWL